MVKEVCCSLPLKLYKTSKNCDQVMLLLIAATYSCCLLVTGSYKGTITSLLSKKLDVKTQESTEFITFRPLEASLLCSGAQVRNSVDPCVLRSNYYLDNVSSSSEAKGIVLH